MRKPVSKVGGSRVVFIAHAVALIAAIGGCGGGSGGPAPPPSGGGNPPPPPPPPPPPTPDTGGGLWFGSLFRSNQYVNDAACLVVESGDLACFVMSPRQVDDDGPMHFDQTVAALQGNLQISETNDASGSGRIHAAPGQVLADGFSVLAGFAIIDGSIDRQNRYIEMTFSVLGEEMELRAAYMPFYATTGNETVWPAQGVYTEFEVHGDPAALTIDEDGTLFFQTASGCSGNGHMININPEQLPDAGGYNAFTVNLTIQNCQDLDGEYQGLATRVARASDYGADRLAIAVFNETTAIVGTALK